MFVRIFENLEEELPSLSPTEMILLDNIIKNTIVGVLLYLDSRHWSLVL